MSDIVYSWNFNPLEIIYNEQGMTDIIDVVHWQYTATLSTETDSVQQQIIGSVRLQSPTTEGFIPFDTITKEVVTNWVISELGNEKVGQMQTNLSSSISMIVSPIKGTVSPPWEN